MGVPPNGTFSYVWSLTTDDGPLEGDPGCLTQLYQSTVSLERDLASGLVGTLLICKHSTIDTRGRLVRRTCKIMMNMPISVQWMFSPTCTTNIMPCVSFAESAAECSWAQIKNGA